MSSDRPKARLKYRVIDMYMNIIIRGLKPFRQDEKHICCQHEPSLTYALHIISLIGAVVVCYAG
jgi:hypothetical protein